MYIHHTYIFYIHDRSKITGFSAIKKSYKNDYPIYPISIRYLSNIGYPINNTLIERFIFFWPFCRSVCHLSVCLVGLCSDSESRNFLCRNLCSGIPSVPIRHSKNAGILVAEQIFKMNTKTLKLGGGVRGIHI